MNKNEKQFYCVNGELKIGDIVLSTPEDSKRILYWRR